MMTVSTLTSVIFNFYLSKRNNVNDNDKNHLKYLKLGNYIQMIIFTLLILSILIIPENWLIFNFIFIQLNILFTSIGSCYIQVGLMALVNIQGKLYANASVVGNAIAGVLPSISLILSITLNNGTDNIGIDTSNSSNNMTSSDAIKYFLVSILIAIIAQISIVLMNHYEEKLYNHQINDLNDLDDSSDPEDLHNLHDLNHLEFKNINFKYLWSKLKIVELTIILTFSITLIFPVFASHVESIDNKINKKLFIPLIYLIWNLGDLIGRILSVYTLFQIKSQQILIVYSLLRLLFLPLFLLSNIHNPNNNSNSFKLNDWSYMLAQFFFGITNGQLFSNAYMSIGNLLSTENEKTAAAPFTALIINLSLLLGSVLSFIVVYFVL